MGYVPTLPWRRQRLYLRGRLTSPKESYGDSGPRVYEREGKSKAAIGRACANWAIVVASYIEPQI
jgi:hypothetical protein